MLTSPVYRETVGNEIAFSSPVVNKKSGGRLNESIRPNLGSEVAILSFEKRTPDTERQGLIASKPREYQEQHSTDPVHGALRYFG